MDFSPVNSAIHSEAPTRNGTPEPEEVSLEVNQLTLFFLNRATAKDLKEIWYISEKRSAVILAAREANQGKFRSLTSFMNARTPQLGEDGKKAVLRHFELKSWKLLTRINLNRKALELLNTATARELKEIWQISDMRSSVIIKARNSNPAGFRSLEDFLAAKTPQFGELGKKYVFNYFEVEAYRNRFED